MIRALAEGGLVLDRPDFSMRPGTARVLAADVDVMECCTAVWWRIGAHPGVPGGLCPTRRRLCRSTKRRSTSNGLPGRGILSGGWSGSSPTKTRAASTTRAPSTTTAIRPRELQTGPHQAVRDRERRPDPDGPIDSDESMIERANAVLRSMRDFMEDQPLGFGRYLSAACRLLGTLREMQSRRRMATPESGLPGGRLPPFEPNAVIGLVSDGGAGSCRGWRIGRFGTIRPRHICASSSSACRL